MSNENVFTELNSVNVNEHVEKKNTGKTSLSYLSWCWALQEVLKRYPDATWEVKMFDGKPYIYDDKTGYMVFTSVTINGTTREMWLPVMDGRNDSMLDHPVQHVKVDNWGKEKKWTTEAATMFDINKTIMRCLTKNLAAFGLGLYIYAGEDLPENPDEEDVKPTSTTSSNKNTQPEKTILSPEAEAERNKEVEDLTLRVEQFADVIPKDKREKVDAAINEKNIKYLKSIIAWCQDEVDGKHVAKESA